MITNRDITIYHKYLDESQRIEKWRRTNYDNVWFFATKSANINKGYDDSNKVEVRIPYDRNININDLEIGDIIVDGKLEQEINTQQDLKDYSIYNITSINNNNFGLNQHIHLGGK